MMNPPYDGYRRKYYNRNLRSILSAIALMVTVPLLTYYFSTDGKWQILAVTAVLDLSLYLLYRKMKKRRS